MDIEGLRILRELHERGSLSAVAEATGVTASAVSQRISTLQRRMGTPLTEKRGRVLVLTDAGRELANAGVKIFAAVAEADDAIHRYRSDTSQTVSVAAFHSAALTYLAPLLSRAAQHEGLTLSCSDQDVAQEDFARLVADHDLVVAHRLPGSEPWPTTVSVTPLVFEPLDIALSASHPLAGRATLTPAEVANEEWIAVHDGFPLSGALAAIASIAGRELTIRHRINEFFVAASLVGAGHAIALMPRYTGASALGAPIVLRPLRGVSIGRQIDILARPETMRRAAVKIVVSELLSVVAEHS